MELKVLIKQGFLLNLWSNSDLHRFRFFTFTLFFLFFFWKVLSLYDILIFLINVSEYGFSYIRTESTTLFLYGKIWVRKKPYSGIVYTGYSIPWQIHKIYDIANAIKATVLNENHVLDLKIKRKYLDKYFLLVTEVVVLKSLVTTSYAKISFTFPDRTVGVTIH